MCREVADSITWRRFCRIRLDGSVPHPTTLMKLSTRCGSAAVDGLTEALLAKAAQAKLLRTTRLRADTTVVTSNVCYPTDSGLLAKAVRRIAATARRIQTAGGAARTKVGDRSRAAGKRAHDLGSKLKLRTAAGGHAAHAAVHRVTGERAQLAEAATKHAERLLANAKRALRQARAKLLEATRQIAVQARQRVTGVMPCGATRRVSLHDSDARPIAKGRLGKPVEFGHKAQIVDNDDGIVVDHTVEAANPADALHDLGVRTVAIPRKARPTKARQTIEHRPAFRRSVKWRTGSEARISTLKRGYGWHRTRIDTTEGARIRTGHGVLAHHLVKISALAT